MAVQRAGNPRRQKLQQPLVGVRDELVVPISGDPSEQWRTLFKRALLENKGKVVRSRLFDKMLDATETLPTEIKTKLVDPSEVKAYLDMVRDAIDLANQRDASMRVKAEAQAAQAREAAARAAEVVDQQLAEWSDSNPTT